ncbi:MAG: PQQ-binding-like beta-propeller repeat protein [Myxococcota bacterium]
MTGLMLLLWSAPSLAADWPVWGRDATRNMAATDEVVPTQFDPGQFTEDGETVDLSTTEGVKWVAKLGSQTYGNPTLVDGVLYVGTNNDQQLRPGLGGDRSVVRAIDAETGEMTWQLTIPKLGSGKVNDWEYLGICSSPAVVGDLVYVVTNRGEVVALDTKGLTNGNQGLQDEGAYMAGPGKPPVELLPQDADIVWRYDMITDLGVFPHNVTSSSVLAVDDRLYVTTSNGADWSHRNIPSPFSPTLIVLDRATGALLGEEMAGIAEATLHANWSSPAWAPDAGRVIFGAGDGFLYGFTPELVMEDGLPVIKAAWKVDGNKASYREVDGQPVKYATYNGPSEYIGTPVVVDNVAYAAIGQDPEHGPGVGRLTAVHVDSGDTVWTNDGVHRSISTVAVAQGLVFAADYDGRLHAIDQKTGRTRWTHETGAHIWGSPVVLGKHVYLGDEDGVLTVLKVSKKKKLVSTIDLPSPIYSTPIAVDGTLYVPTMTHLYAVDGQ